MLNGNGRLYGPQNALDLGSSSCWNCEGASESKVDPWIQLEFHRHVILSELQVQFQAGFSSELCDVLVRDSQDENWEMLENDVEFEDVHELQTHRLAEERKISGVRLVWTAPKDLYGRIALYRLSAWGVNA